MKRFLVQHRPIITFMLSLLESILLGIYLSLVASNLEVGLSLVDSLLMVDSSLYYIALTLMCVLLHIYIEKLSAMSDEDSKTELVNLILKEACDTFIYPHMNYHIRAMVTICDYRANKRKTIYSHNIVASPERFGEYDIDFGVTGKALIAKTPVAERLLENHIDTYDEDTKKYVEPRLQSILAAPIFSKTEQGKVIAVLAFDSMEPMEKIKFNTDKSKEIAQSWADIIADIIE